MENQAREVNVKYFRKLVGTKCYLSPLNLEDAQTYTQWINDMETGFYMLFNATICNVDKEKAILENLVNSNHIFAIIDSQTDTLIGNCGLHDLNSIDRKTVFGIFLGNKDYWGRGYGTEATCLLLDYAFNILNLHRVELDVFAYNKRGIRCYEKCGFRYGGKKREAHFMAGAYHDILIYDILASEFNDSRINRLFREKTPPLI